MTVTRAGLAKSIDHTLLKPLSTADDVRALCAEAQRLDVWSVCVSPSNVAVARDALNAAAQSGPKSGANVLLTTVVGFPSGAHESSVKAYEASVAAAAGADEIDMVMNLGLAKAGEWGAVTADIATVRAACPNQLLKVIIESAALSDEEIVESCRAAEAAGANYVKTSTGFHSAGGASHQAVALMATTVGGRLGVKASGGIWSAPWALTLLGVGATRLGCSATGALLEGIGEFGGLLEGTTGTDALPGMPGIDASLDPAMGSVVEAGADGGPDVHIVEGY